MARQESLDLLAERLAALRSGELPCEPDFGDKHLPRAIHSEALDVMANVAHYLADLDIRRRDPEYAQMQQRHMDGLIAALRRGAPRQELLKFSFLTFR